MWAFKQLYDKGLAYQGYRVLPYDPKLIAAQCNPVTLRLGCAVM